MVFFIFFITLFLMVMHLRDTTIKHTDRLEKIESQLERKIE